MLLESPLEYFNPTCRENGLSRLEWELWLWSALLGSFQFGKPWEKKKKICVKKEPCVGKKDNIFLIITYILFPNLKMGLKLSGF